MKPKLKEHLFAKLVNELTETARHYAGTQQLRGRISSVVNRYIDAGCRRKGEITMNIAQLARMKDEILTDSYTTD